MENKAYCLSSFLAFRYVYNNDMEFTKRLKRQRYVPIPENVKTFVRNVEETDLAIRNTFHLIQNERLGILLSGGMDSAVLASYMPQHSDAYTFRFCVGKGEFQKDELERAEKIAEICKLNLHYVDIDWGIVEESLPLVMEHKGAPVHSIEPQVCHAAKQAMTDGITMMVIGDGADYVFGGMDGLLSRDWDFNQFVERCLYIDPKDVLSHPDSTAITDLFEQYRIGRNSIDFIRFYDGPVTDESYASYENAFESAGMPYIDPYDHLKLSCPMNLERIRNGESKYIIRKLFGMKYPHLPVPQKNPMPRPVDEYFARWTGPKRHEFRKDIDMNRLTGNQKWLLWCAEQFFNTFD